MKLERTTIKTIITMQKHIASKDVYRSSLTSVILKNDTLYATNGYKAIRYNIFPSTNTNTNTLGLVKDKVDSFDAANRAQLELLLKASSKHQNIFELTNGLHFSDDEKVTSILIKTESIDRIFSNDTGETYNSDNNRLILPSNVMPEIALNAEYLSDIAQVLGDNLRINMIKPLTFKITPHDAIKYSGEAILCGLRN